MIKAAQVWQGQPWGVYAPYLRVRKINNPAPLKPVPEEMLLPMCPLFSRVCLLNNEKQPLRNTLIYTKLKQTTLAALETKRERASGVESHTGTRASTGTLRGPSIDIYINRSPLSIP